MKTISAVFFLALFGVAAAWASPLDQTTAVQTQPDPEAPAVGYLKAGSEPTPAPESLAEVPTGWMAVSLAGPFTAFVQNQDLTKGLDVRPGASLYLEPKAGAVVLTVATPNDKIALTGLHGKWTQVRVDRPVVGYIHLGPLPPAPQPGGPIAAAPTPPPADLGGPGRPAPTEAGASPELPQFFDGLFVSTYRRFAPTRPYPWQLNTPDGSRVAYLDVKRLLLTDQLDNYAGHLVQVFGTIKPVPGTKDIVIQVESLRLK